MQAKPVLPHPWVHENYLPSEYDKNGKPASLGAILESNFGTKIKQEDLLPGEFRQVGEKLTEPKTRRAHIATTFRWALVRNKETGEDAYLRVQKLDSVNLEINALILPTSPNGDAITNTALRNFPITEIAVAYSRDEQIMAANLNIVFHLIAEPEFINNPLIELPKADNSDKFLAMVAHQYATVEKKQPDNNPVKVMASINNKSLPTVQRWLTAARKRQFLPPTRPGRK